MRLERIWLRSRRTMRRYCVNAEKEDFIENFVYSFFNLSNFRLVLIRLRRARKIKSQRNTRLVY